MLSKEKIIMVKKTTCHLKLQNHKWMISFTYHGKEECFYLCKEDALPECFIRTIIQWAVEEYLEERRFEEICQSMN